jgi:integrase
LRRILNVALREGWIKKNPFNGGEPLIVVSFERRRDRILTLDEERRLLDAYGSHPYRRHLRSLLILLLDTGCRKGEALRLRWRSVCFDTRVNTVEGMTTKTLKSRQVMMTGRLFNELSTLWGSSGGDPEATVFGITSNVKNSFRSVCKLAGVKYGGVEGVTLHSLRHTAATRLVNGHLPLQMVGRILGHSQVNTTYRYLSSNLETAAQAAAILEQLHTRDEPDVEEVSGMVN